MKALTEFAEWAANRVHDDKSKKVREGLRLNLHSRSDAHSVKLAELIVMDLLETCEILREHAVGGRIGYGINYGFGWPNLKRKTLDLAVGIPAIPRNRPIGVPIHRLKSKGRKGIRTPPAEQFSRLLIACEAKAVLTEHGKSQPRLWDELSASHQIVHAGSRDTIAAGITLINIAATFISPLRNPRGQKDIVVTAHTQPDDAVSMIDHLRPLARRQSMNAVGFDAYCNFVMNVDNQGTVALWNGPPAPQPGDPDHYGTFLADICRVYSEQYSDLDNLPDSGGLSTEEALTVLANQHPGLLDQAGQLAVNAELPGAPELHAILRVVEVQANGDPDEGNDEDDEG